MSQSCVRVKICGLTNVEDASIAVSAGADAVGLVFYGPSPRFVDIQRAAEIARSVGPFVTTVGLFVDAQPAEVNAVLDQVPLQLLQFHGSESAVYCEQFSRPYIKALRMRPDIDLNAEMEAYPSAQGILLDAYRKGVPGGTGETFDWQRVPKNAKHKIILAGGLSDANVASAVLATSPYAVDVSGGVESQPGKKDNVKVNDFIARAKA